MKADGGQDQGKKVGSFQAHFRIRRGLTGFAVGRPPSKLDEGKMIKDEAG